MSLPSPSAVLRRPLLLLGLLCASVFLGLAPTAFARDWFQARGPMQNGVSLEKNLPEKWSPDPKARNSNLIWRAEYGGRTTPIVMNDRIYFINNVGEGINEQERVLCLDAESGKLLWEYRFNVFHTDVVSVRVGWTNVVGDPETGNVYAHGTQGLFLCLDGKTGKVVWSHSLSEEYGRISGYGGRIASPIVDDNLVIVGMINASWGEHARGGNRFLAVDKRTGHIIWWGETGLPVKDTYACTPVVGVINGERLLVSGGGDGGVHAFKVRTGEKVWSLLIGAGAINIAPVIDGNLIYIGHGEENLSGGERGSMYCLDGSEVAAGKPKVVWKVEGIQFKFPSPVLHGGRLFAADDSATLYCLDAKKGEQLWSHSYGRSGKGSPVWADGKIYVGAVDGKFSILKPGDDSCGVLQKVSLNSRIPGSILEMNGGPAVANGRVYFMTNETCYCIGKSGPVAADGSPAGPQEPPPEMNGKAAYLQVVPADVTLFPGESVSFKAWLYDSHGRFLREAPAEWATAPMLPPPPVPGVPPQVGPPPPMLQGEVSADGKLKVAATPPSQFGGVIAKAEGLTGRARVRVAPRVPYAVDFKKVPVGRSPGGWVNCQGKFAVKVVGGQQVLAKNNTVPSPLVSRANAYITVPSATDYTIAADVMATKKGDEMSDMGIINCRYTLQFAGAYQQLRLLSWEAVPRVDRSISFPWQPGKWYSMKLRVEPKGDKALVLAKAWETGTPEPKDWTIEFEDPTPNREGSAGIYGLARGVGGDKDPGTEIYYDNLKITPNAKK